VRGRIRATGWGLLGVVVVVMTGVVVVGAFRARGSAAFNWWVGWATIEAVVVAVLLGWPALRDKIAGARGELPDMQMTEGELVARVLAEARVARASLIGTDIPGDDAARVPFIRNGSRFREADGATRGDLSSVLEYYQSLSPRRLVVLGQPGCGKTVLALELQVRLLELCAQDPGVAIALLVSAASYASGQPWEKWLAAHLAQRYTMSIETMKRLIRDGRILPLVDGVDEMDDPAGPPERAQALVDELNSWISGRERAAVLVTCRPREYQTLARGLDHATHIEMLPLTGTEAASYLRGQFRTEGELARWEDVLECLEVDPEGLLATQFGTPWRLTLALAAFRDGGDPHRLLPSPETRAIAADQYSHAVDDLLLPGYVSHAVRLHSAGRYTEDEVKDWLTALANGLAWQGRHDKSGSDIRLDDWWLPDGHLGIRLSHVLLASLPSIPWIVAAAVLGNAWFLLPAGAVLLLAATTAGGNVSAQRLDLKNAFTRRGLRVFRRSVLIGYGQWHVPWSLIGILFWLVTGLRGGLRSLLLDYVLFSGLAGVLVGVPAGVSRGLTDAFARNAPHAVEPREVIRADGRFRLAVALAVGILIGLPVGLFFGFLDRNHALGAALGLAAGLTAGITAALSGAPHWDASLLIAGPTDTGNGGASVWTRFYVSVLAGKLRRRGPLRFAEFLDWAQRAGLLRVLGIAYQFRHRQLQDLLTAVSPTISIDADETAPQS
jgi:hypothetical protein